MPALYDYPRHKRINDFVGLVENYAETLITHLSM